MKKKVLLGMSGGVDSSVSAVLLMQAGYEVIGVTFNFFDNINFNESKKNAEIISKQLKIKHINKEYINEFNENVIKYFIQSYEKGETPSPCIVCDEVMKIRKLYEIANENNIDYIATGHYADKYYDEKLKKFFLKKAGDEKKDQTYMLYRLESHILEKMLFPLNNFSKNELRSIAKENNLPNFAQKDSQGICFAEKGYIDFLSENLGEKVKKGYFIDEKGNKIGEHRGYQFYTIGQRRGLDLNIGRAYFVIDIIPDKNEVIIGDYEKLYTKKIEVKEYKLYVDIDIEIGNIIGKPRFSSKGNYGKILKEKEKLYFYYDEANTQNTRGQHIVFYKEDIVIGGGIIYDTK